MLSVTADDVAEPDIEWVCEPPPPAPPVLPFTALQGLVQLDPAAGKFPLIAAAE